MPSTRNYTKVSTFLFVAGLTTIVLLLLPAIESWGLGYVSEQFGFEIVNGALVAKSGAEAPQMMTSTLVNIGENLIHFLKILLWMILVISIVKLLTILIFETIFKNVAQSEIASLARTVLSVVIYFVAFFIVFQSQYPSVNLGAIFTGSAILGIVVGLALQDTLGNLFAGIALQADKPFQVGDVVSISNRGVGVVESVSWRGVKIRTFQNKLLVIANAVLGKETIEVAPSNNLNARVLYFNTVYSDSPAKTAQIVREAVRQVENVSPKLRPIVRISKFGDSGLDWEVKYWIEKYSKYNDTDALIRQRIWYAFQREGISFAYPTRTIHIEKADEEVTVDDRMNELSEHLSLVPIFAPLMEDEMERLAKTSVRRVFAPGEAIVRKGQEGGSMFVIIRGGVKIQLPGPSGPRTINELSVSDFFGEMSLLTGEPRSATVVAGEETEVLQIRKSSIKPIFEANPDLLRLISEIVEERRLLLSDDDSGLAEEGATAETGLIRSIRKFFGIGN